MPALLCSRVQLCDEFQRVSLPRVTLCLDGSMLDLIVDGVLTRTMPAPIPAEQR